MPDLIQSDSVVVTGGVGDLLTVESHLTDAERARIKRMYLASPNADVIRGLVRGCPDWFPNLKEEKLITAWDDWGLVRALHIREELLRICPNPPAGYREAQDLSIRVTFRQLLEARAPYTGSSLLRGGPLAALPAGLPDHYLCVHPGTDSCDFGAGRNMDVLEWTHLARWLLHTGQYAVVVGSDRQRHIQCDRIVDLQGLLTPAQSVEVLRRSTGYVGIDSWLSVLAAQLFGPLDLQIKSRNQHLYVYKRLYYAPHTRYDFIRQDLQVSGPDEWLRGKPVQAESGYLNWCFRDDVWWHPQTLDAVQYDAAYHAKYERYERSDLGRALTQFRAELVRQYCPEGLVLDFGIGSGQFVDCLHGCDRDCVGFDVCEASLAWLQRRGVHRNPWIGSCGDIAAVTMWDSLEHLLAPSKLLARLVPGTWLFVSLPIYPHCPLANGQSPAISQWKHYRPGEHYIYWTADSFRAYLDAQGFEIVSVRDKESQLGREDILTFVARKRMGHRIGAAPFGPAPYSDVNA